MPIHLQGQHQAHPVWKKHCPGTKSRINRFSSIFLPSKPRIPSQRKSSATFNQLVGSRCEFPWEENNGFLGGIPSRSRRKSNMKKHLKHTAYKLVIHAETRTFLVGNKSQALNGKIFKHLNAHLRCKPGGQAASLKELPAATSCHQWPCFVSPQFAFALRC